MKYFFISGGWCRRVLYLLASMMGKIFSKVSICKEKFMDVAGEDKAKCRNYLDREAKCYDPDEIVRRAESKLGEMGYHVCEKNCEHFATWCRYGVAWSDQVSQELEVREVKDNIWMMVTSKVQAEFPLLFVVLRNVGRVAFVYVPTTYLLIINVALVAALQMHAAKQGNIRTTRGVKINDESKIRGGKQDHVAQESQASDGRNIQTKAVMRTSRLVLILTFTFFLLALPSTVNATASSFVPDYGLFTRNRYLTYLLVYLTDLRVCLQSQSKDGLKGNNFDLLYGETQSPTSISVGDGIYLTSVSIGFIINLFYPSSSRVYETYFLYVSTRYPRCLILAVFVLSILANLSLALEFEVREVMVEVWMIVPSRLRVENSDLFLVLRNVSRMAFFYVPVIYLLVINVALVAALRMHASEQMDIRATRGARGKNNREVTCEKSGNQMQQERSRPQGGVCLRAHHVLDRDQRGVGCRTTCARSEAKKHPGIKGSKNE
ncbi:hypothetical protein C0Q70_18310 [Pomacea canaliculata]|uniref:LRAT domain-containing protein n=1 Tax=Pomacea canaliculata TaxID=400727 RepID=A0A2T7NMW3_POMCA|nr:hypothetical protein C0Q70_18310 [Pomacea canaliculata]